MTESAVEDQTTRLPDQSASPTLSVRDLVVRFEIEKNWVTAVGGVSFDVFPGEVLGIVGESGSGKSVTAMSALRLIPQPPGEIAGGQVLYRESSDAEPIDVLQLPYDELRRVRGNEIAMIFQEPMTALNPVFTVGMQVREAVLVHEKVDRAEANRRAAEMLTRVGIPDAEKRLSDYPHQFSGGMRQRVMIAMALVCQPKILVADEPTTALDVTTQAQILELMAEMQGRDESIVLITHDLAVVAERCDRVVVMYGGKVQEVGTARDLFHHPKHPYTKGLLASLPAVGAKKGERLHAIPGNVPSITQLPVGCKFCTRCEEVMDRCHTEEPPLHVLDDGREVRCHLFEDEAK